jgi:hypothetical protein
VGKFYQLYCLPFLLRYSPIHPTGGDEEFQNDGDEKRFSSKTGHSVSTKYRKLIAKEQAAHGTPQKRTMLDGLTGLMSSPHEEEKEETHQPKISFRSLTYVPPVPTVEELDVLTTKAKKKALDVVLEADALIEEIENGDDDDHTASVQ